MYISMHAHTYVYSPQRFFFLHLGILLVCRCEVMGPDKYGNWWSYEPDGMKKMGVCLSLNENAGRPMLGMIELPAGVYVVTMVSVYCVQCASVLVC